MHLNKFLLELLTLLLVPTIIFSAAGNIKSSSRQMRQLYAYDANDANDAN